MTHGSVGKTTAAPLHFHLILVPAGLRHGASPPLLGTLLRALWRAGWFRAQLSALRPLSHPALPSLPAQGPAAWRCGCSVAPAWRLPGPVAPRRGSSRSPGSSPHTAGCRSPAFRGPLRWLGPGRTPAVREEHPAGGRWPALAGTRQPAGPGGWHTHTVRWPGPRGTPRACCRERGHPVQQVGRRSRKQQRPSRERPQGQALGPKCSHLEQLTWAPPPPSASRQGLG